MSVLYIFSALLGAIFVFICHCLGVLPWVTMHAWIVVAIFVAISAILVLIAGHSSHNVATRCVIGAVAPGGPQPDPPPNTPVSARWYIESVTGAAPAVSCSFVEFDERGDYLNFEQHRHAYECVQRLAKDQTPLTLLIYVHGWRHGPQSANVVAFNHFLAQISESYQAAGQPRRVHGVYLAWRGGLLKPVVSRDDLFQHVSALYGGEVVDSRLSARFGRFTFGLESFSYFDRKGVPEHLFSGTAFSRTLFTLAWAAKKTESTSEVFLIGHSLGGLMLERTFQNATISQLTESWRLGQPGAGKLNPLPFDTVLLVNSAAPSIYAKQFQSYLAAHRQAMVLANVEGANAPVFFSLTSAADFATGTIHRVANQFAGLLPTLRREYRGDNFILEDLPGAQNVKVSQAYYYRHTPGHNPLLVNRFVEPIGSASSERPDRWGYMQKNLMRSGLLPTQFTTSGQAGAPARDWIIQFPPETPSFIAFSKYGGRRPVVWTETKRRYPFKDTAYWIVRCTKEIIKNHNDIWSQPAMETYAALHRIALDMRDDPARARRERHTSGPPSSTST